MEGLVKLSATAVSRTGMLCARNEDRFYLNGRFLTGHDLESVQASIDSVLSEYIFSVSGGMNPVSSGKKPGIDIDEESRNLHQIVKSSNNRDISFKFEQFCEGVTQLHEQFNKVFFKDKGFSEGDNEADGEFLPEPKRTAYAGFLVNNGKAAALTVGDARIYMLRDGSLRQLTVDRSKVDRLVRIGILTDEQADRLSDKFKTAPEETGSELKRSEVFSLREGDVYLLCSRGAYQSIDGERLLEILSSYGDTDVIANELVDEACQNDSRDNITAIVIRITKMTLKPSLDDDSDHHARSVFNIINGRVGRNKASKENKGNEENEGNEGNEGSEENEGSEGRNESEETEGSDGSAGSVVDEEEISIPLKGSYRRRYIGISDDEAVMNNDAEYYVRRSPFKRFMTTLVICLSIMALIFAAYKLWVGSGQENYNGGLPLPDTSSGETYEPSGTASGETTADTSETTDNGGETTVSEDTGNSTEPATDNTNVTKYTVKKGDTLINIAKAYYGDGSKYRLIMDANNITNANLIKIGQVIIIPPEE